MTLCQVTADSKVERSSLVAVKLTEKGVVLFGVNAATMELASDGVVGLLGLNGRKRVKVGGVKYVLDVVSDSGEL